MTEGGQEEKGGWGDYDKGKKKTLGDNREGREEIQLKEMI